MSLFVDDNVYSNSLHFSIKADKGLVREYEHISLCLVMEMTEQGHPGLDRFPFKSTSMSFIFSYRSSYRKQWT